jgi:hypothetical protein
LSGGRHSLSVGYERAYAEMLGDVALTPRINPRQLAIFWPKVGARFDRGLMVVGRAVNGWIDVWDLDEPNEVGALAQAARRSGEADVKGDALGWVLEQWRPASGGYNTAQSQFWQTTRRLVTSLEPGSEADWPSRIVWTNLGKLAPWRGGNPGSRLLAIQRRLGPALLQAEVDELAPSRVVVFAGRWWFEPFAKAMGLDVEWRLGLVEGVAIEPGRHWVIAVHPMTRSPEAVADAVLGAFDEPSDRGDRDNGHIT